MKNKTTLLLSTLLVITIAACSNNRQESNDEVIDTAQTTKTEVPTTIGGTYTFGNDVEKGPVGKLLIHPQGENSASFYLDVNNGAPAYNMGMLEGTIVINGNSGTYVSKDEGCKLVFGFSKAQIMINTPKGQGNCGFGNGVIADNTYNLKDQNIPQFYVSGEGKKIYFKAIKVD